MAKWHNYIDGKWVVTDGKPLPDAVSSWEVNIRYSLDALFKDQLEVASFHDSAIDGYLQRGLVEPEVTEQWLRELFNKLPEHIQLTALEWGFSDTPFGDGVCEYVLGEIDAGRPYP